jgi:hypothetical protein
MTSLNIYLSNKMTEIPYFNTPWFDQAALTLKLRKDVSDVFNPAEHDRIRGLEPMLCPKGLPEEAAAQGFQSLWKTLLEDYEYILTEAHAVIVGPDWRRSKGAISEVAIAQAVGLPVWEYAAFLEQGTAAPSLPLLSLNGCTQGLTCDC